MTMVKEQPSIEDFVGEEIFTFVSETDDLDDLLDPGHEGFDVMYFEDSHIEMNELLLSCSMREHGSYTLLHGILTRASVLPEKLPRTSEAFVLITNNTGSATCIKAVSIELVKEIVTKIIKEGKENDLPVSIDDIYVIYGYELTLGLGLDEEEIDSQICSECKALSDKIGGGKTGLKHKNNREAQEEDVSKKKVTLTFSDERGLACTGRLLGLINNTQTFGIINEEDLKRKARTCETTPLKDVIERLDTSDLVKENYRLLLALKKKNNIIYTDPTLLITPIIKSVQIYHNSPMNSAGLIMGDEMEWAFIDEEDTK